MKTQTSAVVKTFDDDMWEGFMGAEAWENGDDPVYREIGRWLIIADADGVEVCDENTGDTNNGWHADLAFPSQKLAIALLTGLSEDFNPNDYGCESRD